MFAYIYLAVCVIYIYVCIYIYIYTHTYGCPLCAMFKALDYGINVSKFELQSCYYVHFRMNTFGKGLNPLILPSMG